MKASQRLQLRLLGQTYRGSAFLPMQSLLLCYMLVISCILREWYSCRCRSDHRVRLPEQLSSLSKVDQCHWSPKLSGDSVDEPVELITNDRRSQDSPTYRTILLMSIACMFQADTLNPFVGPVGAGAGPCKRSLITGNYLVTSAKRIEHLRFLQKGDMVSSS